MTFPFKDAVENIKKQIAHHRKVEARQSTRNKSEEERRESIISETDPINATFPWLSASFVNKLVGGEHDTVIPAGLLNVVYLYKIMEQLSTGQGFREARVLAMTSGNRFFDTLITCFKTLNGFYIITGHVKSTPLHNFIKRQERFNDEELRFYAEELVCAIAFLHSRNIVHRNLTAGNIKLTSEGHIKVYNLDQAYICLDISGRHRNHPKIAGAVGVDAYMPPEMVDGKLYGYTADWWNLGVMLYFMISGQMPFQGNNRRELFKAIKYKKPWFEPGLHQPQTHDLIKALLEKNPSKRLGFHGAKEVERHHYFATTQWPKARSGNNDPPFLPTTSAVTSLPPALCLSLEHLSESEPVQKSFSRRELARQQEFNLDPSQYIDFELEHDWTTYLLPEVSLELALHYLHEELRPPIPKDDLLTIEECISKVPELSTEEKNLFRKYAAGENLSECLTKIKLDNRTFHMVTEAEVMEPRNNVDQFYGATGFQSPEDHGSIANLHKFVTTDVLERISLPASDRSGTSSGNSGARKSRLFSLFSPLRVSVKKLRNEDHDIV